MDAQKEYGEPKDKYAEPVDKYAEPVWRKVAPSMQDGQVRWTSGLAY